MSVSDDDDGDGDGVNEDGDGVNDGDGDNDNDGDGKEDTVTDSGGVRDMYTDGEAKYIRDVANFISTQAFLVGRGRGRGRAQHRQH